MPASRDYDWSRSLDLVGAITGSISSKITSGGGSFNSWDNGSTGRSNLSANYSK